MELETIVFAEDKKVHISSRSDLVNEVILIRGNYDRTTFNSLHFLSYLSPFQLPFAEPTVSSLKYISGASG